MRSALRLTIFGQAAVMPIYGTTMSLLPAKNGCQAGKNHLRHANA